MNSMFVIAGLDPAIHPSSQDFFQMDARVKPAHDIACGVRSATLYRKGRGKEGAT